MSLFDRLRAALGPDSVFAATEDVIMYEYDYGLDRAMPDYQTLQDNVVALVAQNDLASSIEVLKEEGDEKRRAVELDWFLEIRSHEIHGPFERRRKIVKCRLERDKKKWKIVALEPASSPVLTAGKGGPHRVEGIAAGFRPPHLRDGDFDEVRAIDEQHYLDVVPARRLLVRARAGADGS